MSVRWYVEIARKLSDKFLYVVSIPESCAGEEKVLSYTYI